MNSLGTVGLILLSATGALAAAPLIPSTSAGSTPAVQAALEVQPTGSTLTPKEAQVMSADAVSVLRHISDARTDIGNRKMDFARDELNQAAGLLDVIRSDLPTLRIKDRIQIARKHLMTEDTVLVLPDLVPIYSELSLAEGFMPTRLVRQHLDKAKQNLRAGDKKTAINELGAVDSAMVFSEVDLPVKETQADVQAALKLLVSKKPKPADQALKRAERDLRVNFMVLAEPAPRKPGNQAGRAGRAAPARATPAFGISSPDSPGQNQPFPPEVPSQTYG